ncbi:ABC transporter ATP-binding protein [Orbus wheelerorum]|uniref:ABC transporter ATP-binding protein n=1 Tax=Orbus wheelerorum TaxID=3074111 RepID=UPI00370D2C9E
MSDKLKLLEVKNLTLTLSSGKQLLKDISFIVNRNQCLGIVGESGSGKSLTCKAIIGLLEPYFSVQGQILFTPTSSAQGSASNFDLLKQSQKTLQNIRGKAIAIILQHPMSAFDPLYKIGCQVIETLQAHLFITKKEAMLQTLAMMTELGLEKPKQIINKYPHQLSGGMLQRVMIGMALILKPALIIADEPTTALDSITQFQIIKALEKIKQQSKTAMIFISHDLGIIHQIADDIIVMNQGQIVEQGNKNQIFHHATNQYTRYLIDTRKQLLAKFNATLNNNKLTVKENSDATTIAR